MQTPNITLKSIKHVASMSQETHCFSATIYLDGKKFAAVENDGHGGCNNVYPIAPFTRKDIDAVEAAYAKLPKVPVTGTNFTIKQDLEIAVGDLVNAWLVEREVKKDIKKGVIALDENKKLCIWRKNHNFTVESLITAIAKKHPNYVILNDKPVSEIAKYYV